MLRSPAARKTVALLAWLGLLAAFLTAALRHPQGVVGVMEAALAYVRQGPDGGLLLVGIYLVRPLLLLPVTVLTAFCGYLYGPLWGLVAAHLAAVASASVGYGMARWWRGRTASAPGGWQGWMRRGGFATVLVSRLSFVPGDLVNGASGALALPFAPFLAATALGGLPGTVVGVLAGAGMRGHDFRAAAIEVRPGFIAASLALAVLSLLVAWALRRRGAVPVGVPSQPEALPGQLGEVAADRQRGGGGR